MNTNKKLASALLLLAVVPLTSCSMEFPWSDKEPQPLAQPLPVDDKPKRMAISYTTAVGVKADGTVWSWGHADKGEMGMGSNGYQQQATPKPIPNMMSFIEVAAGDAHFLALRKDGTVWSWGDNRYGQLGYETEPEKYSDGSLSGQTYSAIPKQIQGLKDVISVAAGSKHSVVLTKHGDVYAFGGNEFGELGLGYVDTPNASGKSRNINPRLVGHIPNAVKIYVGGGIGVILTMDKKVWVFGDVNGRIGSDYKGILKPTLFTNVPNIIAVGISNGFYLLAENGFVYAVGEWASNKRALNQQEMKHKPTRIKGLSHIVNISYEGETGLAQDGSVWEWGRAAHNFMYSIEAAGYARKVFDMPNAESIDANGWASYAFMLDGSVQFWGRYFAGIRGNGSAKDILSSARSAERLRLTTLENSLWHWK